MAFSVQPLSHSKKDQYLLQDNGKNIIIKQPSILEAQILYDAIQENIKIIKYLFTNEKSIN